jgi:hypothetical protein
MRAKAFLAGGVLLILLGLAAMLRPNIVMPAKHSQTQVGGQTVLIETRRVVEVPRPLSGLVMLCGALLILLRKQPS